FFIKAYQTADGNPNRAYWTDEQLEGLHGTNGIDFSSVAGATNGNMVAWSGAIDFANGSSGGQFGINTPWTTLGIPSVGYPNEDNSSVSASAYLYFPSAGLYNLGVNSDDGFRLTFSKNSHDLLGTEVPNLIFDAGRGIGNNQNIAAINVNQAGYYGVRLMF